MRSNIVAIRGRSIGDWFSNPHFQKVEPRGQKTSSLTSVVKDNMIIEIYESQAT